MGLGMFLSDFSDACRTFSACNFQDVVRPARTPDIKSRCGSEIPERSWSSLLLEMPHISPWQRRTSMFLQSNSFFHTEEDTFIEKQSRHPVINAWEFLSTSFAEGIDAGAIIKDDAGSEAWPNGAPSPKPYSSVGEPPAAPKMRFFDSIPGAPIEPVGSAIGPLPGYGALQESHRFAMELERHREWAFSIMQKTFAFLVISYAAGVHIAIDRAFVWTERT